MTPYFGLYPLAQPAGRACTCGLIALDEDH